MEELLTRREVAKFLRTTPRTLAQWAYEGKGPQFSRPTGGRCLYRRSDVEKWLKEQEQLGRPPLAS